MHFLRFGGVRPIRHLLLVVQLVVAVEVVVEVVAVLVAMAGRARGAHGGGGCGWRSGVRMEEADEWC